MGHGYHRNPGSGGSLVGSDLRGKIDLLEDFLRRESLNAVNKLWSSDSTGYQLYDRYFIIPESDGSWRVEKGCNNIGVFENKKLAASWCIADRHQQINLAREILFYGQEYSRACRRLDWHDNKKYSDSFKRDVQTARRIQDITWKKSLETTLSKLVYRAKYIQIKGFQDETARPGSPANNTKRR